MNEKVTLIPFLAPKDLPMEQRLEIRLANREFEEEAEAARGKTKKALADGPGLLDEKGMRMQCANHLARAVRRMKDDKPDVPGDWEYLQVMTWRELDLVLADLLERTRVGLGAVKGGHEIPLGQAKEALGRLMGVGYYEIMSLISEGVRLEERNV